MEQAERLEQEEMMCRHVISSKKLLSARSLHQNAPALVAEWSPQTGDVVYLTYLLELDVSAAVNLPPPPPLSAARWEWKLFQSLHP